MTPTPRSSSTAAAAATSDRATDRTGNPAAIGEGAPIHDELPHRHPTQLLAGRHVVVTGASRGLGAAIASEAAAQGAQLTLVARDESALNRVASGLRIHGATVRVLALDLRDDEAVADAFRHIEPPDVLVNCAGTNLPQPIEDVTGPGLTLLLDLNVRSLIVASQAAVSAMRRAGRGGVIVNVSSQMGHVGAARRSVYCATKHAVEGFTKALAVELGTEGIRVVSVAPTFAMTDMTASTLTDPTQSQAIIDQIPMGRLCTPAEVAATVAWVASDQASMITGSSIRIDGGWTAR